MRISVEIKLPIGQMDEVTQQNAALVEEAAAAAASLQDQAQGLTQQMSVFKIATDGHARRPVAPRAAALQTRPAVRKAAIQQKSTTAVAPARRSAPALQAPGDGGDWEQF